jgi:hypothetical protein
MDLRLCTLRCSILPEVQPKLSLCARHEGMSGEYLRRAPGTHGPQCRFVSSRKKKISGSETWFLSLSQVLMKTKRKTVQYRDLNVISYYYKTQMTTSNTRCFQDTHILNHISLPPPYNPSAKGTPIRLQRQPYSQRAKVKVKFALEQAMKAQRGSRGIALLFL